MVYIKRLAKLLLCPFVNAHGLVGEAEFLDVFDDSYASIMRYSRGVDGFWVSSSTHPFQSV